MVDKPKPDEEAFVYHSQEDCAVRGTTEREKAVHIRVDRNRMSIKVWPRGKVHTGVKKGRHSRDDTR